MRSKLLMQNKTTKTNVFTIPKRIFEMLKKFSFLLTLFFVFIFTVTLRGNETAKLYFPSTLGSYWIYEDQNGNELTRQVVEGEEISGVTYSGFSYDPELEDWIEFDRHFVPYLFHVGDEWVSYLVGEEVENAVEALLGKEMDSLSQQLQNVFDASTPPELNITVNLIYDVEAEAEENCFLLPLDVTPNEEWDSFNVSAVITFTMDIQGLPDLQGAPPDIPEITINVDMQETGIILGTETVDVPAGTFEDCLKIQFQTDTKISTTDPNPNKDAPGETLTTIWLAPNVGIVKFYQEVEELFLITISDSDSSDASLAQPERDALPAPTVLSYELQRYEIVADESQEAGDEE